LLIKLKIRIAWTSHNGAGIRDHKKGRKVMKKLIRSAIVLFAVIICFVVIHGAALASQPVLDPDCREQCQRDLSICRTQNNNDPQGTDECYRDYRECVALCKVPDPQN
jgi:hypothetical protein